MSEENNGEATDLDLKKLLQVLKAFEQGDFSLRMPVDGTGPGREVAETVNNIININTNIIATIIQVNKEFAVEGKFGTHIETKGLEGVWKGLCDSINMMTLILTAQLRNISEVAEAVSHRDMTKKVTVDAQGEMLKVKNTINEMVDQLAELEKAVQRIAQSRNN